MSAGWRAEPRTCCRVGERLRDRAAIDVEGAELSLLRGAERMVEAYPDVVLIVEFPERGARAFGHRLDDLEARPAATGFASSSSRCKASSRTRRSARMIVP